MKKEDFIFNLRDICEIGVVCAFATVLDTFVKIPVAVGGGSINLAMAPLIFISLHRGWFKGFVAGGIIFGLITCLIDGYGFATYPFDYLIGFGSVAIVGVFRPLIVKENISTSNYVCYGISILCCMIIRLIGSTISGVVIYDYSITASLIYQLTYLTPTLIALLLILLGSLKPINSLFRQLN